MCTLHTAHGAVGVWGSWSLAAVAWIAGLMRSTDDGVMVRQLRSAGGPQLARGAARGGMSGVPHT